MRLALDPTLDPTDYSYSHAIRVRFAETDAMGIVHHASYLPYLEEARVAFLREIGHPYLSVRDEGVDFTVLEVFVRYMQALRFDDVIDVHVMVGAATRATFQVGYLLAIGDVAHATAVTVHGCVTLERKPARLPGWVPGLVDEINASR